MAVFLNNGKLLMEQRGQDRRVYAGYLMCPSGHVEVGETIGQTLRREMMEELGIIVTGSTFLFDIDDTDPSSRQEFRHNFMLVKSYEGIITKTKESEELRWLTYEEVNTRHVIPIVERLVDRLHQAGLF